MISRRRMLALTTAGAVAPLFAAPEQRRFKIGACDWSLGRMADPAAFEIARDIGLDGVQVSLGTEANDMHLRRADVQQRYRDAARATGVEIASLAIGELNRIPFKSDPRTIPWVSDCVDVMRALETKVVLLAFFGAGDLSGDKAGVDEVVRRLAEIAPKAERAGVFLGIESWLSADEHLDIIQPVGSPAVKVYYDVANAEKMGHDIYREIRRLGKERLICELHMKENGALLGHGRVDFAKVRAAIDDIGYSGWMQIEGAVPPGGAVRESYVANREFLRRIFPQ